LESGKKYRSINLEVPQNIEEMINQIPSVCRGCGLIVCSTIYYKPNAVTQDFSRLSSAGD
jgi:hypothetical protein